LSPPTNNSFSLSLQTLNSKDRLFKFLPPPTNKCFLYLAPNPKPQRQTFQVVCDHHPLTTILCSISLQTLNPKARLFRFCSLCTNNNSFSISLQTRNPKSQTSQVFVSTPLITIFFPSLTPNPKPY
jgi:hypothetical protein